jgi:hydroxymethylbilane synthase
MTLRLGTRGSALALAQAKLVADALGGAELVTIRTSGDEPANRGGDKARFVREIEQALLAGDVDLAVHSAKDLPSELPDGLGIAGVPSREDARDAFVGEAASLEAVPEGTRIGTSSLRRRAQLLALRPDLEILELRGNVDTRLGRLRDDFDGLILASAGLRRLGRAGEIAFAFDPGQLTPAPGQGALALEARDRDPASPRAAAITDPAAMAALSCERAAVGVLEASCDTPVGVHAELQPGGRMRARGFCGLPDGSEWIRDELEADAGAPEQLGRDLAERMRAAGGAELLVRAERMAGAHREVP